MHALHSLHGGGTERAISPCTHSIYSVAMYRARQHQYSKFIDTLPVLPSGLRAPPSALGHLRARPSPLRCRAASRRNPYMAWPGECALHCKAVPGRLRAPPGCLRARPSALRYMVASGRSPYRAWPGECALRCRVASGRGFYEAIHTYHETLDWNILKH